MTNLLSPLAFAVALACSGTLSTANELDELLKPSDTGKLTDYHAKESWNQVVDAFRRNDMQQAVTLGNGFLNSNFRTSPYQILGVKVMINLASESESVTTANLNSKGKLDSVMSERAEITAKYGALHEEIRMANATINRLTSNRTVPVQQGTAAYRECLRCAQIIEQANAELEKLQPLIERNRESALEVKTKLSSETKSDTLRLLDMLMEADELEAAFAIANVYLRKTGDDLHIAKKQQDVIRLREIHEKAVKINAAIVSQQKPFAESRYWWAARDEREKALSKVRLQLEDKDLIRMIEAMVKNDELGVEAAIARSDAESKEIVRLAGIDPKTAQTQLVSFKASYPDNPDIETLRIRISGLEASNMKGKVADMLISVENLAETDPEQALVIIATLNETQLDPVERIGLEARIATSSNKAITASLLRANRSLAEVKAKIGGEVAEVVAAETAKLTDQNGDSLELKAASIVRTKIDRSAELPEARATLHGISKSLETISKLKLTTTQSIDLQALRTETRILLQALL